MDGYELQPGEKMAREQAAGNETRGTLCSIRISFAGVLAIALCASPGCRVGPDHGPPTAPLSDQWKNPAETDKEISSVVNADICGPWWSEFRDPVLDRLIQLAVETNPGLYEACFRVLESRARRGVVKGDLFPEVKGTGSYDYKKISGNGSPYAIVSQDSFNLFSTGFDAAWEIDIWGKYRRAVAAADAEVGITANDYNYVLLTLLGDVAAAYVELRMYQQRIEVARQNVKVQEHTLNLAQKRHSVGLTKPLDVAQARSSLHATKATIPALEIGYEQAENRLCVLLGGTPCDLRAQLGTTQPIPTSPQDPSLGMPADLLRRRPDVRSAELKVAAESQRIGIAVADLYPQLSLTGTITVDSTDIVNLFTPESIAHKVGPSLSWNIINFGRLRNRIKAQEARFEQAVWHYQTVVLSAAEEVENALVASKREQVRSKSLELAVAASKESVRLSEIYYSQGLADFQSVLDSQRSLLLQQDQLTVSHAKVTLNRIALYKALGGGWAAATQGVFIDYVEP
ncbi:MAG: efflux transporter outer membrane subunit, partial [Pirellulales bacterium]|nr:efflux transporter outer membrane subunit [Pirellulales bacterium]